MSETISIPEDSVEQKEIVYSSVSEYLSAFEESPQFEEAVNQREIDLKLERPRLVIERQSLVEGTRMSPAYRLALINFFRAGNELPADPNSYNNDTKEAIENYWDFLKSMPTHVKTVSATAKSKEDEVEKLFRMEKTRDRFHTIASLAILGEGITLKNGQKITCDEIDTQEESALSLKDYSVLGRTLVSIITEENALDIVDPEREEKKTAATLNFLNSCQYSSGHWVAKGEK